MKGYYIEITNNLLDPKHIDKMKSSVWLFMWLLDKMTSISEEGIGTVLGGKSIKYEDILQDLGISKRTYHYWVKTLVNNGYIYTKRTGEGLRFFVAKAKKKFGNRCAKNCTSEGKTDVQEIAPRSAKNVTRSAKNVVPLHIDNTKTIQDNTIELFLQNEKFRNTLKDFRVMRKTIRHPLTEAAEKLLYGRLRKHSVEVAIKMLENSILNSWRGVFDLSPEEMAEIKSKDPASKKTFSVPKMSDEQLERNKIKLAEMRQGLVAKLSIKKDEKEQVIS